MGRKQTKIVWLGLLLTAMMVFCSNHSPVRAFGIGRLNCGQWNAVSNPGVGNLTSIAAMSAQDVWAAGGTTAAQLLLHWNGKAWKVVPFLVSGANPGNVISGLAAIDGRNAWAVGILNGQTFTDHWDGKSWNVVASPNVASAQNSLLSVAAVPGTAHLWTVGSYQTAQQSLPLTEYWDGTQWTIVASPALAKQDLALTQVIALSETNVWAFGIASDATHNRTVVEHWDGTRWSLLPKMAQALFYSDATGGAEINSYTFVPGTQTLWAVGSFTPPHSTTATPLAEYWTGRAWKSTPIAPVNVPNGSATGGRFFAVVALSPTDIWTVGQAYGNYALVEQWDGTSWSLNQNPAFSGQSYLNVITSVPGTNSLWAVGGSVGNNHIVHSVTDYYCA
ncbi:hypothetical protein [Tengunoibacter tsumagoiensis]|uniref:Photosynthesis system II assembly factor Ycf48/Hcf136-like domain-containing protein n=1 Tax=Tengunoibacter tsumagoiensis TaxID=2014871 RepID=A0A401ZVK4_9CHLR|nr:hypothetical protein [Tengunoibacter tsumagoiensis]GCE10826.1 hypothetical protein KTT_06850 [Tengunoibacter tsumagoiensis]